MCQHGGIGQRCLGVLKSFDHGRVPEQGLGLVSYGCKKWLHDPGGGWNKAVIKVDHA